MKLLKEFIALTCLVATLFSCQQEKQSHFPISLETPVLGQWSKEKANEWYGQHRWLVGCNYTPQTAINQIEMWQASTWDPETIEMELDWAADIGMNTLRVYLHYLVWGDDEQGLYKRMDEFLEICDSRGIKPFFVFFDDCHFPEGKLGPQPLPIAEFHNSCWLNSPGRDLAYRYSQGTATQEEIALLKDYLQKTMQHFKDDKRILMWELYNEPGMGHLNPEDDTVKADRGGPSILGSYSWFANQSNQLVYDSWVWAREASPSQPITSTAKGGAGESNVAINRLNSDVYSIHCYDNVDKMRNVIKDFQKEDRPILMTEWLAREFDCTVQDCLPLMKEMNVAAINWGLVNGKTQTAYSWTSHKVDGVYRDHIKEREEGNVLKAGEPFPEPELWFHDLLRADGTPYDEEEIALFKKLTK